jgi:hypothetical protein
MRLRPIKMAVVLLLGFVLAWQGVFALSAPIGSTARGGKQGCCRTACDDKHCATSGCCVKRDAPSAPVAPASLPSTSQNEVHALAAPTLSLLALPARAANELPTRAPSPSSVAAVPLFKRDCSYLL